eukprot:scaffold54624_cov60-Phaeocystis_antarctica.AAC.4
MPGSKRIRARWGDRGCRTGIGAGAADARDRGGLSDREYLRSQGRELIRLQGRELIRLQARVSETRGRPVAIWWQARRHTVAGLWRVVVVAKRTASATLTMAKLHVAIPPMPVLTVLTVLTVHIAHRIGGHPGVAVGWAPPGEGRAPARAQRPRQAGSGWLKSAGLRLGLRVQAWAAQRLA